MDYKSAIDEVLLFLKNNHLNFYLKESESEIKEFINNYIKDNPISCDEDFTYLIRMVIKKTLGEYDSHTRFKRKERRMPLLFKYLKDGFYVVKTADGFDQYKFGKLVGINGVPIEKIASEIEAITCYSTNGHLLSESENILSRTEVLILPSISKDSLTYQLVVDGKQVELSVDINENYEYNIKNNPNYHYYVNDDSLILTYNSCKDREQMEKTVENIKKTISENNIKNFILDLRGNEGGNSGVIEPLIDYLKQNSFNIVTLVDRYVFSAGRWAVGEMRKLNSILIGEEIGTSLNCFGENRNKNIEINGVDHSIAYSIKYFGFNKEYNIVSTNLNHEDLDNTELIYDSPDIYVDEDINDLKIGRDKYLECALNYLGSIKSRK